MLFLHHQTKQSQRRCYAKEIPYHYDSWFKQFRALKDQYTNLVLLESGRGGRYSIVGLEPIAIIKGKNSHVSIAIDGKIHSFEGNPLKILKNFLKKYDTPFNPDYPEFQGGAIGYISYDYIRYVEELADLSVDDLELPDIYFYVFDDVFIFDHETSTLWLMTHDHINHEQQAMERLHRLEELWTRETPDSPMRTSLNNCSKYERLDVSFTEDSFIDAVNKVKEYIEAGDVFQVNLSVRQSKALQTDAFHIYGKLREINPSPYMAYMQFPEFQVVSGSPELLIKKKGKEISTRPIAGTRSRGKNGEEDLRLAQELINNEKERAEHVMLVDLERNDIGRVCEYGTVEVNEFMVIEKYSHVMHIVSNVKGKLNQKHSLAEIVDAVFPGGTITGAPKVRTMEIIEELEPVRRGLYTGSIGWISYNGDMELNIAIRTMIVKDNVCHVQTGAGIVIDSNPQAEYNESLKKGKALWKAKELSEKEYNEMRTEIVE